MDPEHIKKIFSESKSKAEVLRKLHLVAYGGNYTTIDRFIRKYAIDVSHFNPHGLGITKSFKPWIDDSKLFIENSKCTRTVARRRIKHLNLIPYKCNSCGIDEWNNKPLSLQLDHLNGINNDHRLENLQWLCPNCHSQTETWGSKRGLPGTGLEPVRSVKAARVFRTLVSTNSTILAKCCICGESCLSRTKNMMCRKCYDAQRKTKIQWPENLAELVVTTPMTKLSEQLGVTAQAISKRCKRLNIPLLGNGYWSKKRAADSPIHLSHGPGG
jgi:hypothetical protein